MFKVSWRTPVAYDIVYDLYWREPMLIYMCQVSIWTFCVVELWGRSMAVNPLFPLMHSPISEAVLLDSRIIVIVVSISELLGTIAYSFFWPVHWICANFCVFRIISNVPDINLLYNLSLVVPGEVLTPPCSLGFGIQRFGYYCRLVIVKVSAGAVIVLGHTAGKSLFSLLRCLRLNNLIT